MPAERQELDSLRGQDADGDRGASEGPRHSPDDKSGHSAVMLPPILARRPGESTSPDYAAAGKSSLSSLVDDRPARPVSLPSLMLSSDRDGLRDGPNGRAGEHRMTNGNGSTTLPPLVVSAPLVPTKGSSQSALASLSSSSPWLGPASPPLAHSAPASARPLPSPRFADSAVKRGTADRERYDAEATDRFGSFRMLPPPLSTTTSTSGHSTNNTPLTSSRSSLGLPPFSSSRSGLHTHTAYPRDRQPSETASSPRERHAVSSTRRLSSPRSSYAPQLHDDFPRGGLGISSADLSPERAYKRLRTSPSRSMEPSRPSRQWTHAGSYQPPSDELDYTPEELFFKLKNVPFNGTFASVGLNGPSADFLAREDAAYARGLKGNKQDIWTDDAEFAFLAAELYLPTAVNSKVMFFNKACGRNEIIGLIITMAIGKLMTRKQVSSHLQVVRQRKNLDNAIKEVFDKYGKEGKEPIAGTTVAALGGLHPFLYQLMGINPTIDLSRLDKPKWIERLEDQHPGAEYQHRAPFRTGQSGASSMRNSSGSPTMLSPTYAAPNHSGQGAAAGGNHYAYSGSKRKTPTSEESDFEGDRSRSVRRMPMEDVKDTSLRARPVSREGEEELRDGDKALKEHRPSFGSRPRFDEPASDHQQGRYSRTNPPKLQLSHANLHYPDGTSLAQCKLHPALPYPNIDFDKIPSANTRFKGVPELAKSYGAKVLHVNVTADVATMIQHPDELLFDIGIGGLMPVEACPSRLYSASTSGFMIGSQGRIGVVHIQVMHGETAGGRGSMSYRSQIPFVERDLPMLVAEGKEPEANILPQYWVMQEIFTASHEERYLVGSRLSEGRDLSPAAVAAEAIGLVLLYSFRQGKPAIRVERVNFASRAN